MKVMNSKYVYYHNVINGGHIYKMKVVIGGEYRRFMQIHREIKNN